MTRFLMILALGSVTFLAFVPQVEADESEVTGLTCSSCEQSTPTPGCDSCQALRAKPVYTTSFSNCPAPDYRSYRAPVKMYPHDPAYFNPNPDY